ncbi:RodZ family helix-turn-helix domain-containing protein [Pseudomonas sp. AN-1]|uniref:RodZ family helix-turn-helix domain-containing protein n=1 Tax=Pseudomonas sp. AN-1 TaxID=3096605 RepID=UPI002A6B104F|nr:RodZ family helix-turn-helix domain-containing protein [Pseudomonas sp. AN-1]WPP45318.1 RodZ family helix-turn-helix domain-containing protein [Pseudomonas sp. AN-1]
MTMSHIEAVGASSRSNPGEILRQAREEKGWQLAEVAAQLNLTAHSLAQLEAGEFDRLPGHTFARGYVRAYAKLLGLDQAELVGIFDHYTGTDATGSTVHSLGHVPEPLRLSRTVLRLASAVLLLLLLVLGYFWWQERPERLADLGALGLKHIEVESADGTTELHPLDEPEDQAVAEALQGEPTLAPIPAEAGGEGAEPAAADPAAPALPATPPALTATPPAPAGESASATQPTAVAAQAVAPTPVAGALPAPAVAPAAEAPPAAEPAAPAPQVAAGEGLVQLSFTADCWTQVTDANGRVLVSTVKRAGDSLQLAGKAPLELRLGNARVAQVRYNGEPVEHRKNMTASGTARIKLGQ